MAVSTNDSTRTCATQRMPPVTAPVESIHAKQFASASLPRAFPLRVGGGKTIDIPSVGFGTWAFDGGPTDPAKPEWIKNALKVAFDAGYRHLECAWFYGVDREIGQAIREYGLARDEVFICTKIWPNFYQPDKVELCCDKILEGMGVDYVDCLILHWPCAFEPISPDALSSANASNQADMTEKGMALTQDGRLVIDWKYTSEPIARAGGHPEGSIVPTWSALKELYKKGKTRSIGVSNFGIADLKALLPHAHDVPISLNQVEAHPWFPNQQLKDFCDEHAILMTCFSPFAGQKSDGKTLIHDPTVKRVAAENGMGVGQLLQSWAVQRGTIPLGKSGNPGRIEANFAIRRLSNEDAETLSRLRIPNDEGRSIDFREEWGVALWQS